METYCYCSVAKFCDPMGCSMPGFPVFPCFPESAQIHVHWVDDAIYPLSWWYHPTISSSVIPFSARLQSFPASGSFPMSHFFTWVGQSIGVSALASVLPKNTQGWSPLERTGWSPYSPRDSQEFFPTPQFKSINSSVLSFLHSPTLTSIHDH